MTTVDVHHFYHMTAGLAWQDAVTAHVAAYRKAKIPGAVTVGMTGPLTLRDDAREWLADRWPAAEVVEHDRSLGEHEDATLALARTWGYDHPDGMVLYCHAKGSYQPAPFQDAWRESMTADVVTGWRFCVRQLAEYDVAGPHWLDPAVFPNMRVASAENGGSDTPYFGGNFWWATGKYLATLPAPRHDTRWDAERWIGLGKPRACDLRPGWPGMMIFTGKTAANLLRE